MENRLSLHATCSNRKVSPESLPSNCRNMLGCALQLVAFAAAPSRVHMTTTERTLDRAAHSPARVQTSSPHCESLTHSAPLLDVNEQPARQTISMRAADRIWLL